MIPDDADLARWKRTALLLLVAALAFAWGWVGHWAFG
jgi:hypothetical protein